jgi:hypothetical protein
MIVYKITSGNFLKDEVLVQPKKHTFGQIFKLILIKC